VDLNATEGQAAQPPQNSRAEPLTFEEVYDDNVDFVWRVVARLGVRPAAVEDVVQEVFVVVHRKLGEFQGMSSVRTWLFQIARGAVYNHRRTVRRKETPTTPSDTDESFDVERVPARGESSPEMAAARAQAVRLLHAILSDMDDQKREVFVLAELEQLPAPEIAEAIGVNVNTVYSRLRLAREAFNQALVRHHAHASARRIR
jgi:RNA polymerase sigma-70 factor, ECF subfamily